MHAAEGRGFWSGGRKAYLKALREEEEQAVAPLREALRTAATPAERKRLEEAIASVRAEFEGKRKAGGPGLFTKP